MANKRASAGEEYSYQGQSNQQWRNYQSRADSDEAFGSVEKVKIVFRCVRASQRGGGCKSSGGQGLANVLYVR
jgi:hypothetical protein